MIATSTTQSLTTLWNMGHGRRKNGGTEYLVFRDVGTDIWNAVISDPPTCTAILIYYTYMHAVIRLAINYKNTAVICEGQVYV